VALDGPVVTDSVEKQRPERSDLPRLACAR
jgi:hypothetical protein